MTPPLFSGLATALVTPFCDRGIDYGKMAQLIDRQAQCGAAAIVVCGTTGEAAALSPDERTALTEFSVTHTNGRMKVVAGIGANNTEAAVSAARAAAAAGADGTLLTAPYYNKTNRAGLVRHFTYVADRSEIPLIVYNVPGRTSIGCSAEIYVQLSGHPMINGIKEASGDLSLVSRTQQMCGDALHIWCGNDDQTLPMMALGAKGVISVASNIIPREMVDLCSACLLENYAGARGLHRRYAGLFDALFMEVNPIPIKTAMNLLGLDVGPLRMPLYEMSPEHTNALRQCLSDLGLLPDTCRK